MAGVDPVVERNGRSGPRSTSSARCCRCCAATTTRGGWASVSYILLNELAEKLAGAGLSLNFITYLMGQYGMTQVTAASIISIFSGTSSFTPLLGAFLADAYIGRFWTIASAGVAHLIGSLLLLLTAACHTLQPGQAAATVGQLAVLYAALCFNAIAAGGLRPCTYAFGADQLVTEGDNKENKRETQSFFNWYFFFLYLSSLAGATLLVYVQDHAGWVWGFLVPAVFILIALAMLVLGSPWFCYVPPTGSPFTAFARVLVAAFRKRKHPLPMEDNLLFQGQPEASLQDGESNDLPHTERLKWLDHAAILMESDYAKDGSVKTGSFQLCTTNEVEQLKAVVALTPIWIVNVLSTTVLSQHSAFGVPQARLMDRQLGSSGFQIPPASVGMFGTVTLLLWMPFYDRVLVPNARKVTGYPGGIRELQRIGIGFFLSVVGMVVAGAVEQRRRRVAHDGERLRVWWLIPQQMLYGLGESLHAVGQLEFLYDQLPYNMRNVAGAVFWLSSGVGHYCGTIILQVVHHVTAAHGRVEWLTDDLDRGHYDYFLYLLALLQAATFLMFIAVSNHYKYKGHVYNNNAPSKELFLTATPLENA